MFRFLTRALKRPVLFVAVSWLVILVGAALLAPHLGLRSPTAISARNFLAGPGAIYLLGADELGRDMLSRIIFGARSSLAIAFGAVAVALVAGTVVGAVSAMVRGFLEVVVMRAIDVILTLPALLLAIATATFLGTTVPYLIAVLGFVYFPRFARVAHAAVLQIMQLDYVDACEALGATRLRLFFSTILPNAVGPLLIQTSLSLAFVLTTEAALSFLGLGPPPPTPTWGRMINQSRAYMDLAPHLLLFPASVLALTILSFNTIGDQLRDLVDPHRRNQR